MTYVELVEEIQQRYPDVSTGKLFSMPCLKLGGKAIGGYWRGDFVAKLSSGDAAEALKIPGSCQLAPGPNHVMKQWIVVPVSHNEQWLRLAESAVKYQLSQMGVRDGNK